TRPVGSNDRFTDKQMDQAAGGGIWWVVQDSEGGPVITRHQLTTDTTSLKTREYSVTKSLDRVAKRFRAHMRPYTGNRNITRKLLEELSFVLNGAADQSAGTDMAEVSVDSLTVSATSPDEIEAEVSTVPFYPTNRIKLKIIA
ncbi:MAG: hypothetical protein ACOYOB_21460, partial [Myxococcota bacterium]